MRREWIHSIRKKYLLWSTPVVVLTLGFFIYQGIFLNPILRPISVWQLQALPSENQKGITAPFFYLLGSWPQSSSEGDVVYSIPYEKGPPQKFVGKMVGRFGEFQKTKIQLILEGPKTPLKSEPIESIRSCFLSALSYRCLKIKEQVLRRHLEEMKDLALLPRDWSLRWFQVANPNVPREDQPEGIYLRAHSATQVQHRFILIHTNGRHQTIRLDSPRTEAGEKAFQQVVQSVRSLRNFSELTPVRDWIDHKLSEVRLSSLNSLPDPHQQARRLTEIQILLLSRISVDPASYESYFHLAGTSLILNQKAKNLLNQKTESITEASRQNLQSAYQYANDLAPQDPRTTQLYYLWTESQKKSPAPSPQKGG